VGRLRPPFFLLETSVPRAFRGSLLEEGKYNRSYLTILLTRLHILYRVLIRMKTPLSIQRTKLLLSRPKILESLAGTASKLTAGELQVFPLNVFLRPWSNRLASSCNGRKLNLRRDLRWVAKGSPKFPCKYAPAAKKKKKRFQDYGHSTALQYPVFYWLKGYYSNEQTSIDLQRLGLGGQTVTENLSLLACKEWAQVIACQSECTQGQAKQSCK